MKLSTHLHLVPLSKNMWSYTSTSQYVSIGRFLVKHRENFTFNFTFIVVNYDPSHGVMATLSFIVFVFLSGTHLIKLVELT